jgi:hypothetical protein
MSECNRFTIGKLASITIDDAPDAPVAKSIRVDPSFLRRVPEEVAHA